MGEVSNGQEWFLNPSGKGPLIFKKGLRGYRLTEVSHVIDKSVCIIDSKRRIQGVFEVAFQGEDGREAFRVFKRRVPSNIWEALCRLYPKTDIPCKGD